MAKQESLLQARFILNPLYWFTWAGMGLLYLSIFLPYRWMLAVGTGLGWLSYILLPSRRRITRTNIRLAFPELDEKQVSRLVKQNFYSAAIAVFESALAWWASDEKIKPMLKVEGLEHFDAAKAIDKGILLLGGHYTTLEISGRLLAYFSDDVYPTYKSAHNPLFEVIMKKNRSRMNKGLVASNDMRSTLKLIKQKQIVWYASDQDFGLDRSVFAPFMGVQTATLDMSGRLAKRAGAPVVPYYSERLPGSQGYLIRFGPILKNFPTGDPVQDATMVNAAIEDQVRRTPEQYLWGHRRFKTRPHGEPPIYKPRRGKFMRSYTYAHVLLSLPIIIYTLWIAIKNKNPGYFFQRVGLHNPASVDLMLHAASIGEVNAAAPLVKKIHQANPGIKILITTNTPSGQITARHHFKDTVDYCYLPIDWHWLSNRFLSRVSPRCMLVMETEIWPNLYEYCYYKGITNIIVNARLSDKSINVPKFIYHWLSHTARYTSAILARSEEDAEKFSRHFEIKPEHLKVIGNIKYASKMATEVSDLNLGRPYILFASSRDGEEIELVKTWRNIKAEKPLLVIAPRHIHRLGTILSDLGDIEPEVIAVRSRDDKIKENTQIYIADTFGELASFIAFSEFVIMGGSFAPFGGQNIIEVAQAGKAVVFGPNMDNFKLEAREFIDAGAAIQVHDQLELKTCLATLLENPDRIKDMGAAGKALTKKYQDVLQNYYDEIKSLCKVIN